MSCKTVTVERFGQAPSIMSLSHKTRRLPISGQHDTINEVMESPLFCVSDFKLYNVTFELARLNINYNVDLNLCCSFSSN